MRRRGVCTGKRAAIASAIALAAILGVVPPALAEDVMDLGVGQEPALTAESIELGSEVETGLGDEVIVLENESLDEDTVHEVRDTSDGEWLDGRGVAGPTEGSEDPAITTQSTAHTRSEALAWVSAQIGKALDIDGQFGAQCVDLTCYYYQYLGKAIPWGNANQYVNGGVFCPAGWSYQSSPQPGDVAVWMSGEVGHVAIVTEVRGSQMVCMEQNLNGMYCTSNVHNVNANTYIRPDWPSEAPTYSIPGPIADRSYVDFATGDYVIRSAIGNRVLDIEGGKLYSNGGNAQLWDPLDNVDQIWHVEFKRNIKAKDLPDGAYRISLKESGKNLDAEGGTASTVANVLQWGNYDGSNQHWCFQDAGDGWVYILNKNGYYLDVSGGWESNRNGGNVQTWTFNGSDAQKWKLVRVSGVPATRATDGDYVIRSAIGNKVLDVSSASAAEGAKVQIWSENGGAAQLFRVGWNEGLSANNMRLAKTDNVNRWLDKAGGDGTGVVSQYAGNDGYNQNWFFENAGNGWYYIRNIFGYYLDVSDAIDNNGTAVQCWHFNGSNAQKWRLEKPSLAYATVSAIGSMPYTGSAIMPSPQVSYGGRTLSLGSDYDIAYSNNTAGGTASISIAGKGAFVGTKRVNFSIVAPSVSYRTHVQRIGWQGWKSNGTMAGTSGKSLRLEGINIKLGTKPVEGGIRYSTHVQSIGWQGWKSNGEMSGTSGRSLRLEAIRIQLTGEMSQRYSVWYRVHAQKFGWMGWACDGASAGTEGYAYRLEALQVLILPKGSAAPGSTSNSFKKKNLYASTLNQMKKKSTASKLRYVYADVYGDSNKELICMVYNPGGNGMAKTLYVYTLSKGAAKLMLKHYLLCSGDFGYTFYKNTGGLDLHEGSTGRYGQQHTIFVARKGAYKKVAHRFLAIGTSSWRYSSNYDKSVTPIAKGNTVVLGSSATW